jgi:D-alanyl-D-alanine carboxypeptidase/D-alanyl-D-alanine-endopeptidase (penicillin-binding protein 4)
VRRSQHRGGTGVRLTRGAVLAGLTALSLTGCGGSSHPSASTGRSATAPGPAPATATTPPAGASGAAAEASAAPVAAGSSGAQANKPSLPPAQARLNAALTRLLRKAGRQSGALVYDLNAHQPVFALRDAVGRPPASVEKLYTTLALLRMLGPGARLHTVVLGTGHLAKHGVWRGNLYLRGGGDPTFGDGAFNRVWEEGYGPTATQLTAQLRGAGIRRVTGKLIGDASLFDSHRGGPSTNFAPDIPDFGGQLSALTYDHGATLGTLSPGAFAARELALALRAARVRVRAAHDTGVTPHRARTLAMVSSPPLSVLLRLMDVRSDDLFAEMLTEQLGARFGTSGSIAGGAPVIASAITSYGVHPRIVDGSGLSRDDRSSPAQIVSLLRAAWQTPEGNVMAASLPIVGVSGTVERIGVHTPAQGNCIAKTGTLNNVTNLAGYCHRPGHHRLAFALMLDGPSNTRGLQLIGRMVSALAKY